MKIIGVIPVRLDSKRFPKKALFEMAGMPLIQHVYLAATTIIQFDKVIVATDSVKIFECVKGFNGNVVMTSPLHQSGTERMGELLKGHEDYDVFVNIQADQPFLNQEMIDALIAPYLAGDMVEMTTIACPLREMAELDNENTVKVLLDQKGNAIYFSRSHIPFNRRKTKDIPVYHHIGLYAFSRVFLSTYVSLAATPLEHCESLEQLRALEHGYNIRVNLVSDFVPEINTMQDIEIARAMNLF